MAGRLKDSRQIGQFLGDLNDVVAEKRRSAGGGEFLELEGVVRVEIMFIVSLAVETKYILVRFDIHIERLIQGHSIQSGKVQSVQGKTGN